MKTVYAVRLPHANITRIKSVISLINDRIMSFVVFHCGKYNVKYIYQTNLFCAKKQINKKALVFKGFGLVEFSTDKANKFFSGSVF